jgi:putative ABC transport system substrate-binding protein
MRRRDFVKLFAGTTVAWSSVAGAQQLPSPARIGWMSLVTTGASDPFMDAFRKGMIELGYVEGQNFLMEPRYGAGKFELMVEQATELERAGVDVIIAGPFDALRAAKQSTNRVPIIMTPSADPVTTGIVASLDHPGGNITGITEMMPELTPERLRLLKQIIPALSRVAIMWRPGTLSEEAFRQMIGETRATASQLGVEVEIVEAAEVKDFDAAFAAMAKAHVEALIVLVNPMYVAQRKQIVDRANDLHIPGIYEWRFFVQQGGLISYGADVFDIYRRAAGLVDKILKGARPADLPVEKATKVEMSVNIKSAQSLGLTIPEAIVRQAVAVVK